MNTQAPPPLEWHPAYRDQTWLLDWLNGNTAYPRDQIVLPVPHRINLLNMEDVDAPLEMPSMHTITMRKCQAWGHAPYVGRPFVYTWMVGVDELGRSVASDSTIAFVDGEEWSD